MKKQTAHSQIVSMLVLAPLLLLCNQSSAGPGLNQTSVDIEIGSAAKLDATGSKAEDIQWTSSAPKIAEVFSNGFVVGLTPGEAQVRVVDARANESAECLVRVEPVRQQIVDPATLKQFPDNRQFVSNGRKCFGSELNGQRASDPDERRFTRSNRVINPKPLRADKLLEWEVALGTEVFDGAGVLMGTVAPTLEAGNRRLPVSKFNFGASKVLHGRICVYAFSVSIVPTAETAKLIQPGDAQDARVATSAWLPLDSVVDKAELLARAGLDRNKLPALPLEAQGWRVTGGNPRMYETPEGELSIVHNVKFGAVPSHYLRRPSGTINLVYSVPGFGLGGEGADSFLLSENLEFFPAHGAKVFRQPTYFPAKHPQAGETSPQTMTFIYGAIKCSGTEPVYGWIAKEALAPEAGKSN